jgi:hypothetical protein
VSEFPWDHTDRFWGSGLHVSCSAEDARSLIAALTEALDDLEAPREQGIDAEPDQSRSAWRSAIDAGDRAPGLSVSVADDESSNLDVSADMERHAKVRDVIAAAVADYDPTLADANPPRLVAEDRDRIRAAVVDAHLSPDEIADVYQQAMSAAEATRDHRWAEAGFRYEASRQRDGGRDGASFGLAAEDTGRGWSL